MQNLELLLDCCQSVVGDLLPALLSLLDSSGKAGSTASPGLCFAALKACSDVTLFLMQQPAVYDAALSPFAAAAAAEASSGSSGSGSGSASAALRKTTQAVNELVVRQLLPVMHVLLADKEPIPQVRDHRWASFRSC